MYRRSVLLVLVNLAVSGFLPFARPASARADGYPDHTLKLVLPTSPGSGAALWGQVFSRLLSKNLGQPVDLLFKPGGSGNDMARYLLSQPADGYTIGQWAMSYAGYMNLPTFCCTPSDFEYVLATEKQLFVLVTQRDAPFKTINDAIEYARANPGKLDIGATKVGSIHHQHILNFSRAAGINVKYIPYQGSGEILKEVLGRHLSIGLMQPGLAMPQVKAGQLRVLLLLNETRLPELSDVPTPKELGFDYELVHQIYGVMVKKGVPDDRVTVIREAFRRAMDDPEYEQYVKTQPGVVPSFMDTKRLTPLFLRQFGETREFLVQAGVLRK